MYFLYSFLLTLGFLLLTPRLLLAAVRHRKYVTGLRERLGNVPVINTNSHPVIWLHCVSVGEAQAALPLARELMKEHPQHTLVVSTTTLTGQRLAKNIFRSVATNVFYFPIDWAFAVRWTLDRINPQLVLIMETELWPRFLRECHARQVPVALVNGRLSARSVQRYKRIGWFFKSVLNNLTLAIMQTTEDARRIEKLGLAPHRIAISGNVKFDFDDSISNNTLTDELRQRFAFNDECPLIVAASTHEPEERIVIEAFKHTRGQLKGKSTAALPRLLLAPRHPERFAEVATQLESSGLQWARRSASPNPHDKGAEVMLLDTIGELRSVYPLASLVFVGGSLAPVGGHNILEPAAAAKCIITGAHTHNFEAIIETFLAVAALCQLPSATFEETPSLLAGAFTDLLVDDERRNSIGTRARLTLEAHRGATQRTLELLAPLLAESSAQQATAHVAVAPRETLPGIMPR